MIIKYEVTVILDPIKEYETMIKYMNSDSWHEDSCNTGVAIYKKSSPPILTDAQFIDYEV